MAWLFRRRRSGRHRMQAPCAGVVLPGFALHISEELGADTVETWTEPRTDHDSQQPADVIEPPAAVDAPEPEPEAVASVPEPRAAEEPEIMPLPARVVLTFVDGSTQLITPLSDDAERMRAAAERLMGVPGTTRPGG